MAVNIRQAMTDPHLFGGTFGGDSFTAWRALLAGFYGLALDATETDIFKTLTGREETPTGAHDELWLSGRPHRCRRWGFYFCRLTISASLARAC